MLLWTTPDASGMSPTSKLTFWGRGLFASVCVCADMNRVFGSLGRICELALKEVTASLMSACQHCLNLPQPP